MKRKPRRALRHSRPTDAEIHPLRQDYFGDRYIAPELLGLVFSERHRVAWKAPAKEK